MLVYIHIPYCHKICPYCSFYKHSEGVGEAKEFVQAVLTEARWKKEQILSQQNECAVKTVYLGGGTPSFLPQKHLKTLLLGLREIFSWDDSTEVTLEANPATFHLNKAKSFVSGGVSRVSLGVQSFSPHVLKTLGRDHSPQEAKEAFWILKEAGVKAVNVDLMFSIPGQKLSDWQDSLEQVLALNPEHISAYNLTYEEDTPFLEALQEGHLDECEDRNADHFLLAERLLVGAGYDHYETSNYAKTGYQSVHNKGYWDGLPYLGLGPSAVSTLGERRMSNIADTVRYIQQVQVSGHALQDEERIDQEAYRIERIALLMRTSRGVPLHYFKKEEQAAIEVLLEEGLAVSHQERLVPKGRGQLLVDELVSYIL